MLPYNDPSFTFGLLPLGPCISIHFVTNESTSVSVPACDKLSSFLRIFLAIKVLVKLGYEWVGLI